MERSHQPQEVSESEEDVLCPSLSRLVAENQPQSEFQWLLLTLHCLMVECGFAAVEAEAEAEVKKKAKQNTSDSLWRFNLPESVLSQLRLLSRSSAVSASIRYSYSSSGRNCTAAAGYALLKVVNEGGQAGCHCGVAPEPGLPAVACASQHFCMAKFFGRDSTGMVRSLAPRELGVQFKDRIAMPARAALLEVSGLPPPKASLAALPPELLLKLLRSCGNFVDICRLGQTCHLLAALHRDNSVWRLLLWRHFKLHVQAGVSCYEAFRVRHMDRVRRTRMVARLGSRELSPLPSPLLLEAATAAAAAMDLRSAARYPNRFGSGRRSLQDLLLLLPGGGGGGAELSRLLGLGGGGSGRSEGSWSRPGWEGEAATAALNLAHPRLGFQ